jgi:hypothetical protein
MEVPRVILVKICSEASTICGMLNPHLHQKLNMYTKSKLNPNFLIQNMCF